MIKYPTNKQVVASKKTSTSNRGMILEDAINQSNAYYLANDRAVIYKKPTPIQIVKVDYPRRSAAKIVEAYFKVASTTDFNGIYRGKYIDFEVKQVANQSKFILANIHLHQIQHLKKVHQHGGIAFVIIGFTGRDEVYLMDCAHVIQAYEKRETNLSYDYIVNNGKLIKQGYLPQLDYLSVVDSIYFNTEVSQ